MTGTQIEVFRVKGCYRVGASIAGMVFLIPGIGVCLWALMSNEREVERLKPILVVIGLFFGLGIGGLLLLTGLWYRGIRVAISPEGIQYKRQPVVPWDSIVDVEVVPWGNKKALLLTHRAGGRAGRIKVVSFVDGFDYLCGLIEKRVSGEK